MGRSCRLELSNGGCRSSDGFGGAAGKRPVPIADGIRDERLVAERAAVPAGAVAAAFPYASDELGRRPILSLLHQYKTKTSDPFVRDIFAHPGI